VACPYQARHITHKSQFAFGATSTDSEEKCFDEKRMSVARSGPSHLDSSGGVYKCNPGELRVIHGGAVAWAVYR